MGEKKKEIVAKALRSFTLVLHNDGDCLEPHGLWAVDPLIARIEAASVLTLDVESQTLYCLAEEVSCFRMEDLEALVKDGLVEIAPA